MRPLKTIKENGYLHQSMFRKIALAVGLLLNCAGMICTLIVLKAIGDYLGEQWPPSWGLPVNMPFDRFIGLMTVPTGVFVVSGFLLVAFGILYPKQSAEPIVEIQTEKEDKKSQI
jgi:hypothetical protein